mmetsp:Transcript_91227/g.212217  ORF Transcript_91227/g.212217 Transcript_91227/m.212217 type:complete len:205 (-) Transcript_91227:1092-1706(-)
MSRHSVDSCNTRSTPVALRESLTDKVRRASVSKGSTAVSSARRAKASVFCGVSHSLNGLPTSVSNPNNASAATELSASLWSRRATQKTTRLSSTVLTSADVVARRTPVKPISGRSSSWAISSSTCNALRTSTVIRAKVSWGNRLQYTHMHRLRTSTLRELSGSFSSLPPPSFKRSLAKEFKRRSGARADVCSAMSSMACPSRHC